MGAPPTELPRGTVTFLFTDIEGSTNLARKLGADFGPLRAQHHHLLRDAIAHHGGHEIDTAGDGFFVAFERAGEAVAAAVEAQRAFADSEIQVRMGLHSAEPYIHDGAYLGVGVHRAARICAAGHGGQVLLSNATAGIVEDLGLEGIALVELGEHRLKDIERPQRLFQLVVDGLIAEFPPLKSLDQPAAGPALVSLLFTDLEGWGALTRKLGDEVSAGIARAYAEIVGGAVAAENGRVLEIAADHTLSRFNWPREALRAAAAIREGLATEPWCLAEARLPVRMAVHSGRIADLTSSYLGTVAAHGHSLCRVAVGGQILVSHAAEALLAGEAPGVSLHDLGDRRLPGLDQPVRVFELP